MLEVAQLGIVGVIGAAVIVMVLIAYGEAFIRARLRRARLSSGKVRDAEEAVQEEVTAGLSPRSYRTFAHAALGEFSSARRGQLAGGNSGSLEALDYHLCGRILIAAFENDARRALELAERLLYSPLDGARHRARREAVISVARVLAGVIDDEDWKHLGRAAVHEPVLLWPCRYAAARVLHSFGRAEQVGALIGSAPPWPPTSHFAHLHQQLCPDSGSALDSARSPRAPHLGAPRGLRLTQ